MLDKVIVGFASSERVVMAGDSVFVANAGEKLEPFTKDGDGFISWLEPQGKVRAYVEERLERAQGHDRGQRGTLCGRHRPRPGLGISDGWQVFELGLAPTGVRFRNAPAAFSGHRLQF